jgi:hypothetical protein
MKLISLCATKLLHGIMESVVLPFSISPLSVEGSDLVQQR